MRYEPSSPSMTAVGVLGSAANTASSHFGSSAASSVIQPRSPPPAAEASVETDLATSSHFLPPVVTSASACLGLLLRGGLLRRGRLVRAVVDLGVDRDDPGVALLGRGRLLDDLGVDLLRGDGDALRRREVSLDLAVDQPFEHERREILARGLLAERLRRLLALGARHPPAWTAAWMRACCCWSRQTSIWACSVKSSRVIVWPPTVAAAERWSR